MTLWLIGGLASLGIAFVGVLAFACCVAAGRADTALGLK